MIVTLTQGCRIRGVGNASTSLKEGRTTQSPIPNDTTLSHILTLNHGVMPTNMTDFVKLLDRYYSDAESVSLGLAVRKSIAPEVGYRNWRDHKTDNLIVPFSRAPGYTDLLEPRLIYYSPRGDFFLAVIPRIDGTYDVEFLSRNLRTNEFDFGIINDFGTMQATPVLAKREECTRCHKNESAIFVRFPWSGSLGQSVGGSSDDRKNIPRTFPMLRAFLEVQKDQFQNSLLIKHALDKKIESGKV